MDISKFVDDWDQHEVQEPVPMSLNHLKTSNPTLFSLLKIGAFIEFPSGVWLKGDPEDGYIKIGTDVGGSMGLWNLDREGLAQAMLDKSEWERSVRELELNEL